MKKTSFHQGWKVKSGIAGPFDMLFGPRAEEREITLPHDAMIEEVRDPNTASGSQYGYYPAKSYTYTKCFFVPKDWEEKQTILEFEGVQRKAMVYLNGEFIGSNAYGYSGFFVDLTPHLKPGQENLLKVLAINEEQAFRWYPGSGIYRDVWLWQSGDIYLVPEKQRITTVSVEDGYAVLRLEGDIQNESKYPKKLRLDLKIQDTQGNDAGSGYIIVPVPAKGTARYHTMITLDNPKLWSDNTPDFYRCDYSLADGEVGLDDHTETFGIRMLALDARKGLRVNGVPVKLRGACIHHDNGIIGATTLYDAEYFRLKKLKEAGFNAIRSAHNPASKAMLRACDELGIYVMEELCDMWNEPKNAHDLALDFASVWRKEAQRMVDKDYNHPSVILYSTGNELPEIGRVSGAVQGNQIAEALREMDHTRYTTFGVNGFLAVTDDMHLFAAAMQQPAQTESSGGSEELNSMMGGTQQQMMDAFAVSDLLTNRLEAAASGVDVVGYNYLTSRHVLEHQLHPDRIVVGSETYPPEISRLWKIVEENRHVIGDFSWTGYDYLGEAGIGIYHYDADHNAQGWYPDRLAYCGDIDLNGNRRPVSYLREIAYGLRKTPYIAVERVDKFGKHYDENNWKYADCIDSWTFPGYENKPARVRVLAGCEEVELFLNGASLGRKPVGTEEAWTAFFELSYQPGELTATGYTAGVAVGSVTLKTADTAVNMQVNADKATLIADGQSLAFLTVDLLDAKGNRNRWDEKEVTVTVEGAAILQGFGSAAPSGGGTYQDHTWKTWDGRVMAVIRSTQETGNIRVRFSAPGCEDEVIELESVNH